MSPRDLWRASLHCPVCSRLGTTVLFHRDGSDFDAPATVTEVAPGCDCRDSELVDQAAYDHALAEAAGRKHRLQHGFPRPCVRGLERLGFFETKEAIRV